MVSFSKTTLRNGLRTTGCNTFAADEVPPRADAESLAARIVDALPATVDPGIADDLSQVWGREPARQHVPVASLAARVSATQVKSALSVFISKCVGPRSVKT